MLVCPAQFGTENDYEELVDSLRARGHPTIVAPLKPTDWLRLIPASLTPAYWKGELDPDVALPFYYEALDAASAQLTKDYPGRPIQLVAHSIGGWITALYLGQITPEPARSVRRARDARGTPHAPPPEGIFRTLDQTRGLLRYVEERYPGAHFAAEGLRYLTVGSRAQAGALPWAKNADGERTTGLLAGVLALASYLPLCGDGFAVGDGILARLRSPRWRRATSRCVPYWLRAWRASPPHRHPVVWLAGSARAVGRLFAVGRACQHGGVSATLIGMRFGCAMSK